MSTSKLSVLVHVFVTYHIFLHAQMGVNDKIMHKLISYKPMTYEYFEK